MLVLSIGEIEISPFLWLAKYSKGCIRSAIFLKGSNVLRFWKTSLVESSSFKDSKSFIFKTKVASLGTTSKIEFSVFTLVVQVIHNKIINAYSNVCLMS